MLERVYALIVDRISSLSPPRRQYRNFVNGRTPCSLTEQRIHILNAIGFCWEMGRTGDRSPDRITPEHDTAITSNDTNWFHQLYELQRAVETYVTDETCDKSSVALTEVVSSNSSLGKWLQRQRLLYQNKYACYPNSTPNHSMKSCIALLSKRHEMALQRVHPYWWMTARELRWERHYQELQQYAREHGNCCVPISYCNKQLANFVSNTRKQYNLQKQGKPSSLTSYRMDRLNNIGFVWNRWEYEFEKQQSRWNESNYPIL